MPDERLLSWQPVALAEPLHRLVGRHGKPAICQGWGEEIINQREIAGGGSVLCRACAGQAYYRPAQAAEQPARLCPCEV
ncbi:MAG: hypothetical protein IT317_14380 [Anaerolineales bacterium]|nr:hypothetical protein [Anaerolineales bacterium]